MQNNSFSGTGMEDEVPSGSSCLESGEVNSVWYIFTATVSGNLLFQLDPLSVGDDYDFALYNLTNDSCSGIMAGINQPISCNYSSTPGSTGLANGATGNQNGSSAANQNAPMAVQAGQTFALLISNFTASQSGYELNFSGSASIVDNNAGAIQSISLEGQCNPDRVRIYFTDQFMCSSLAGNGSDLSITGPGGVVIASTNAISCSGGATNQLWLNFTDNIPAVGTYTVTINTGTDGNTLLDGCGNEMAVGTSFQFEVEFLGPEANVVNVVSSDCGLDNGSATAVVTGGVPPYTFNWNSSPSQNTATASNLGPRVYRVAVTDANGCTTREFVTIANNNPISVAIGTVTPVSCNGATDGSAQVVPSGITPFTIEWQTDPVQTGPTATNLPGGNVDVVVTDATGCDQEVTVNIPQPAQIAVPMTVVNPDCGMTNGSATVNATGGNGGFSYAWNTIPAQNTATASGLGAGVYGVTVTDVNGCSRSGTVILADNFAPNATIENRVPDCGQGMGQATALATSGVGPFSYSWNTTPPQNTPTATNLTVGDYFVTITDGSGCTQIINVKIDSIPPPVVSLATVQPTCGQADGMATATTIGGWEPYTYTWSSSANNTGTETGLAEGTYSVTVTDSTGCTDSETFTLEQLPPLSDFTFTNVCDGEEMTFEPTTTSGAVAWSWDFGDGNMSDQQNPTLTYAAPGEYEVTVIFSGGCMNDTATHTVSVFAPPTAAFVVEPQMVTTRTDANFVYTGSGGTEFLWNLGGLISTDQRPQYTFPEEGLYDISLMVTDANGCTDTITQTIEVMLQPVIYLPNAFMPQGTTANSRFKAYGIGVVAAELSIFDRWGTLLYYSDDINEILNAGWDGTYKGKPAPQDAYPYRLKASFYNNTSFEKLGTVTLVR
jgi:gliding motility-associated-like protein